MITNELGSQYDAENQAVQEARRIQLEAYQAALLGTPPPTQDAEDELTVTDDTGVQYRIPLSQLTTQNERFEISTLRTGSSSFSATDWDVNEFSGKLRFDKSQFTGYRSIVFRSWITQGNEELTGTISLRLVDVDNVPVAGSELEHTGTGNEFGLNTTVYESGDISSELLDEPTEYYLSGKLSDIGLNMIINDAAIVVRFGPEAPDAPPDPPPAATPNGHAPGPTLQGANHLWDFVAYGIEGTGLLYDTGTEGTLPLTQPTSNNYNPTTGPGGSINIGTETKFRNDLGPYPQLGTDDFTLLWVGEFPSGGFFNVEMLSLGMSGNSIGLYGSGGNGVDTAPYMKLDLCYGNNCSEYFNSYSDTEAEFPGLVYGSLTRQGTQLVLASNIDSTTFTIPVDADLTPTGSPLEMRVGSGQFGFTNAVAVWQGYALTPEQIEAAAIELGWPPDAIPADDPTIQGANHAWVAADYAGTGPFLDTGTTGGIDLANADQGLFEDGQLYSPSMRNDSATPQLGTDQFTYLWVGTSQTTTAPWFIMNQFDYEGDYGVANLTATNFSLPISMEFGTGGVSTSRDTTIALEHDTVIYVSMTRRGRLWTVTTATGTWSTLGTAGDVTGSTTYIGGNNARTNGAAIWLGAILTPEQIEAAATELGWVA